MEFLHQVIVQDGRMTPSYQVRYDGPDAAEAHAVWSKAILDGVEYVTLESMLRDRPKEAK